MFFKVKKKINNNKPVKIGFKRLSGLYTAL